MSYKIFFAFSEGLDGPLLVPPGTLRVCQSHVTRVTRALGFKVKRGPDGAPRWRSKTPHVGVSDATFCTVAQEHNDWVRKLYDYFETWSNATPENPPEGAWVEGYGGRHVLHYGQPHAPPDTLTPADAKTFWYGLRTLDVPLARWTAAHYRNRMEHLYAVMRRGEHEGVSFDARTLSTAQAAAVIRLFAPYLDAHSLDLDVPNGYDELAALSDGGYEWCAKCGPVVSEDGDACTRKACPKRAERDAEHPASARRWVVKDKPAGTYLGRTPGEWPTKLNGRVLRFTDRAQAEAQVRLHPKRALVVVPVRRT